MRLATIFLMCGVSLLVADAAVAGPACGDKKSTYEQRDCAKADYDKADKSLNQVYQATIRKLSASGQGKTKISELRAVQRRWITMRDAKCAAEAKEEWGNGSGAIAAQYACMEARTIERTKELADKYEIN